MATSSSSLSSSSATERGGDILRIPWRLRRSISRHSISTLLLLLRVANDDQASVTRNPEKFPIEFPEQLAGEFFTL
jgi:hypothetical protein